MIYIVAYELQPKRDISALINELKSLNGWAHSIDNVWFVGTEGTYSAKELYERLSKYLTKADQLFVIEFPVAADYQGWLPSTLWDWLRDMREKGH